MRKRMILWILRLIVGGVFVIAGLLKIRGFQAFADDIATFQILPVVLINPVAMTLPPFEVLIGLSLIVGGDKSAAGLGVMVLATIFGIALAQGLIRGLPIDCGCFGEGSPSTLRSGLSLVRDLLLIGCSAVLYYQTAKPAKA